MASDDRKVPTLDELAADPAKAHGLPHAALLQLSAHAVAAQSAIAMALLATSTETALEREDALLSARQLAQRMSVNVQYVYEHAAEWPFRVEMRPLRFSRRGFEAWVAEGGQNLAVRRGARRMRQLGKGGS